MPPVGARASTSPQMVNAQLRHTEAVRLVVTGFSMAEIAAALGYATVGSARQAITRALRRDRAPAVETYRQLQDARLSSLLRQALQAAMDQYGVRPRRQEHESEERFQERLDAWRSDRAHALKTMDQARQIEESLMKLWGTADPKQVDLSAERRPVRIATVGDFRAAYSMLGPPPEDLDAEVYDLGEDEVSTVESSLLAVGSRAHSVDCPSVEEA